MSCLLKYRTALIKRIWPSTVKIIPMNVILTRLPSLIDVNRRSLGFFFLRSGELPLQRGIFTFPHDYQYDYKEIGETKKDQYINLSVTLESSERYFLKKAERLFGQKPILESKLHFSRLWVVKKSIEKEKVVYLAEKVYEEVHISEFPLDANLISSHHFFNVENYGFADKQKRKCRIFRMETKTRTKLIFVVNP